MVEGDLILIVRTRNQRKLLVSSTILCNASPVFKARLSPDFCYYTSAQRSPESPQVNFLLDDSATAVLDMCSLLHHQMNFVRQGVWYARRLFNLAKTADKYECADILRLQTQAHF